MDSSAAGLGGVTVQLLPHGRRKVYVEEGWEFGLTYLGDLVRSGRPWLPSPSLAARIGTKPYDSVQDALAGGLGNPVTVPPNAGPVEQVRSSRRKPCATRHRPTSASRRDKLLGRVQEK